MNFYNKKSRKIMSSIIIIILVLAMIVPTLAYLIHYSRRFELPTCLSLPFKLGVMRAISSVLAAVVWSPTIDGDYFCVFFDFFCNAMRKKYVVFLTL